MEPSITLSSSIYLGIANSYIIQKSKVFCILVLIHLVFAPNSLDILSNTRKKLEKMLDYKFWRVEI